jgi:hypothetical protein
MLAGAAAPTVLLHIIVSLSSVHPARRSGDMLHFNSGKPADRPKYSTGG